MANLLMLVPRAITALAASRGSSAANLLTDDPKEVWSDSAVGSAVSIDIDLGAEVAIDTICLAAVYGAAAGATWSIAAGDLGYTEITLKPSGALRAVDAAGQAPTVSHAFWTGASVNVRYVRITLFQPAGSLPLKVGRALVGKAFIPQFNKEWGAGRGVIDTGTATRLPSGGFAIAQGAKLGTYRWTFGDLSESETEQLYALQIETGQTGPLLVVEDPAATAGQRNRIHYGLLTSLRPFERRNPRQTRWELSIEEWI